MARCRDATQHNDVHGVQTAVAAVERRCHRLLELAKNEQRSTKDPVQSYSLSTTIDKMENGKMQHLVCVMFTFVSNSIISGDRQLCCGAVKCS